LSITAAATPPSGGYGGGAALVLPSLGLFGTVLTTSKRKLFTRKSVVRMSILGLLLLVSLFSLGCGSNSSNKPASTSQTNLTVTGTSGAISHSSVVAITIN
jgi:hypothetical protein